MVFGYAYPAYECFKAVEKNEPDIEQLLFWCQYWYGTMDQVIQHLILILDFVKSRRTVKLSWHSSYIFDYVYNVLLRPYVGKHEKEIDLNLLKLRIKARDISLLFWEKAAIYWQARFFGILQYFSSHSASLSHSDQQQQEATEEEFPVIKLSRDQEANGGCSGLQQANNKA
ncbi:hypothetical protein CUMW_258930, partial [Citrus unshiu]